MKPSFLKIDCHTHIVTEAMREEYFSRTDGIAIVMPFLQRFVDFGFPDDSLHVVAGEKRLFLSPTIDIAAPLEPQLKRIETLLPYKVVGLKIFLTYQKGRADEERLMPIYDFAEEHRLTLTYHTGSCALLLPSDNDMEGSNARYIRNVALRYPKVNFVIAHMDDPRYDACVQLMHGVPNLFTDFCGCFEPGTKEDADRAWATDTFGHALHQFPDVYQQVLYGTDFCPPLNLSEIEAYETTMSALFPPEECAKIYYENALRAFPRLNDYLN